MELRAISGVIVKTLWALFWPVMLDALIIGICLGLVIGGMLAFISASFPFGRVGLLGTLTLSLTIGLGIFAGKVMHFAGTWWTTWRMLRALEQYEKVE